MSTISLPRLRRERLKWGLTQKELAPLLLISHPTQLSRIELGARKPSIKCVLASTMLFKHDVQELFPGLHGQVEDRLAIASKKLYEASLDDKRPEGAKKRELLLAVASGAIPVCK